MDEIKEESMEEKDDLDNRGGETVFEGRHLTAIFHRNRSCYIRGAWKNTISILFPIKIMFILSIVDILIIIIAMIFSVVFILYIAPAPLPVWPASCTSMASALAPASRSRGTTHLSILTPYTWGQGVRGAQGYRCCY